MRKIAIAVAIAGLGTALAACTPTNLPPSVSNAASSAPSGADVGATVTVINSAFSPRVVTISAGQAVEWQWARPSYPAQIQFGDFSSNLQDKGSYWHVFTTPGTYDYANTMADAQTGIVIVVK